MHLKQHHLVLFLGHVPYYSKYDSCANVTVMTVVLLFYPLHTLYVDKSPRRAKQNKQHDAKQAKRRNKNLITNVLKLVF